MFVKKVKSKCMVKGCKNTDCFTLTAGREFGNSVIICGSCLKSALYEVEHYDPGKIKKAKKTAPPPLFFRDKLMPVEETKKQTKPENTRKKPEMKHEEDAKPAAGARAKERKAVEE